MRHLWLKLVLLTLATVSFAQEPQLKKQFDFSGPAIAEYGKVVQLPEAVQQPRAGSKIVVDVTGGGEADKINPAIEKLARFVNIYAGAGKQPAAVKIAAVLHGQATLSILKADIYALRHGTQGNPNLDCLQKLQAAGVKMFVCGQSLVGSQAAPSDVDSTCEVAVSALTALVNLQSDGHAYVPLK